MRAPAFAARLLAASSATVLFSLKLRVICRQNANRVVGVTAVHDATVMAVMRDFSTVDVFAVSPDGALLSAMLSFPVVSWKVLSRLHIASDSWGSVAVLYDGKVSVCQPSHRWTLVDGQWSPWQRTHCMTIVDRNEIKDNAAAVAVDAARVTADESLIAVGHRNGTVALFR